ncbi:DUF3606 domain-containing protein [Massilia cavernae]|uniref:DUF3606 domain-containing protein n=1 Tax=Massilia cavernae TaxID=2320864 RepID=A0A418XR12_9BURK|nr:DUF3606 domain-containing protein [Massilia cavernae]RJG14964.1 DUF3606 domain-containing protein [Massilia cavernae]
MSDNPLEPGPQDYDRINVNVESELAYWSRELGVSRPHLAELIEKVGPGVLDIKRRLAEENRPPRFDGIPP